MEFALLFTISLVLGGGVAGGVLTAWGLAFRVWRLEKDLAELQVKWLSETRKRAASGRWTQAQAAEELAKVQPVASRDKPWWEDAIGR